MQYAAFVLPYPRSPRASWLCNIALSGSLALFVLVSHQKIVNVIYFLAVDRAYNMCVRALAQLPPPHRAQGLPTDPPPHLPLNLQSRRPNKLFQ